MSLKTISAPQYVSGVVNPTSRDAAKASRIRRTAKRLGVKASWWSIGRGARGSDALVGWHFVNPQTGALLTGDLGISDDSALEWLEERRRTA
ncbi:MAG: hypothetical protein R3E46_04260 [Sedimenticolaceae bacterium]